VRLRLLALPSIAAVAALSAAMAPNAATAAAFGTPVRVSTRAVSEPSIDVAPDGTLYINAPAGIGSKLPFSPSYIWRSADQGATWTETPFGLRADTLGGGDSDISVAPDGKLAWTDLWLGSSTVGQSVDKAQTWTSNDLQGTLAQDRQWVAAVGGNVVYHVTHQIPGGLIVSKSVDGGVTYPVSYSAATVLDATGCICPPGNMVAEAGTQIVAGQQAASVSDKVGVAYYTSTGGVKFARSINGGLTWTQTEIKAASSLDTGKAFPVVANAGGGVLVAVWQEQGPSSSNVGFNISTNWGATWGTPQVIVSSGSSAFPWVDARNGKIGVSLYHTTSTGLPDNMGGSTQWNESYLESTTSAPTTWTTLQDADTGVKSGAICTNGLNCSSGRELGDFQSIVLDSSGRPNLTYMRIGGTNPGVYFVRQ
jgi:hypothetical protein